MGYTVVHLSAYIQTLPHSCMTTLPSSVFLSLPRWIVCMPCVTLSIHCCHAVLCGNHPPPTSSQSLNDLLWLPPRGASPIQTTYRQHQHSDTWPQRVTSCCIQRGDNEHTLSCRIWLHSTVQLCSHYPTEWCQRQPKEEIHVSLTDIPMCVSCGEQYTGHSFQQGQG